MTTERSIRFPGFSQALFSGAGIGREVWNAWNKKKMEAAMKTKEEFDSQEVSFGNLTNGEGAEIPLKGVDIRGEVDGTAFIATVTQRYKNESARAIEAIYTFPLGWNAVLLGMTARLGDREFAGEVIARREAEKTYEKALAGGDSAILVQRTGTGLYTASLGNLAPGEEAELKIRTIQLLRYEDNRIRLCIPTVIGERYGEEHVQGRLGAHETARAAAGVRYPFSLKITVRKTLAKGEVACPSHPVAMRQTEEGLEVKLVGEGWLDRDFVLTVHGAASSHAVCVPDGEGWMALASFYPRIPSAAVSAIALKILVDCSGSMDGMSIREVKKGLKEVVRLLGEGDRVSYSRFGTRVAHLFDEPKPCSRRNLDQVEQAIDNTRADMGGTELEEALASTFALKDRKSASAEERVLLLTDGDIWEVEKTVATAKDAGQRVFVIGVGAAPAHSLLEDLAEQTGGACIFVTPNEDMTEAVVRMFQRMRNGLADGIRLAWPQNPLWSSPAPAGIYDGETVHAAAFFQEKPAAGPTLEWRPGGMRKERLRIETVEAEENRDLARFGGMWRLKTAKGRLTKRKLALRYALVSDFTSLVLVARREDGEKLHGLPLVRQVPQMPAHGHGCFSDAAPLMTRVGAPLPAGGSEVNKSFFDASRAIDGEIPCFIRIDGEWPEPVEEGSPVPAAALFLQAAEIRNFFAQVKKLWRVQNHLAPGSVAEFVAIVKKDGALASCAAVVDSLAQDAGAPVEETWKAFLLWLFSGDGRPLERHEKRRLICGLEAGRKALLEAWFEGMRLLAQG